MTENPLRAALEDALFSLDAITDKVDGTGFNISDEFSRCLDSIDLIRAALATPSDAPEQTAKPRHYVNTIAAHNSEMCCRLGITMGHLRDDGSRELECILERLDRAQKQIAQQAAPEQATLKRYDPKFGYQYAYAQTPSAYMEEYPDGDYVLFDDLAAPSPQQRDESKGETT